VDFRLGNVVTVVQGMAAVSMVACLSVFGSQYPAEPPQRPTNSAPLSGAPVFVSQALFGPAIRLDSYSGFVARHTGDQGVEQAYLVLWPQWEALGPVDYPYSYSVIPVAPDGQAGPTATLQQPFREIYPMSCWKPVDGILTDQIEVPLFKPQAGDWWASFSLVDGATGQNLPVVLPDGTRDTQVGLGPFR
jgi:hypothetical protein